MTDLPLPLLYALGVLLDLLDVLVTDIGLVQEFHLGGPLLGVLLLDTVVDVHGDPVDVLFLDTRLSLLGLVVALHCLHLVD